MLGRKLTLGIVLNCALCIILVPAVVFGQSCICEVEYTESMVCKSDNVNWPFTKTITFNGADGGKSVWDIMRQYLSAGYPDVCDEETPFLREQFLIEVQARVDQQCRSAPGGPVRDLTKCYVVDSYSGNIPNISLVTTPSGGNTAGNTCITESSGDILRGCSPTLPDPLAYENEISVFFVGDHNNCTFHTEGQDDVYPSQTYRVQCPPQTQTEAPTTPPSGVTISVGAGNYEPIAFEFPSEREELRGTSARSFPILIGRGIRFVTGLFGSIALVMIIYGGLEMMISGGNGDRFKSGAKVIAWASIGLVTMMLSYVLVSFVLGAVL